MTPKITRIIGISLIVCSWILWGILLILPLFRLTMTQYTILYPAILAATNIFWIGAALVGKELVGKFNIPAKIKKLLKIKG